jgi:hypothetical protein
MTRSTDAKDMCHKSPPICSACRTHIPVLSVLMPYHRVCNKINTICATCRSETAFPLRRTGANPLFCRVPRCLVFCVVFCRPLLVLFVIFFILPLLLPFTASDYPLISSIVSSTNTNSTDLQLVFQNTTCKTWMQYQDNYISVSNRI